MIPDAPDMVAGHAQHKHEYAFHGAVTAQTMLRQSFNVPAVEALSRVGQGRFVAALRQAGGSRRRWSGDQRDLTVEKC